MRPLGLARTAVATLAFAVGAATVLPARATVGATPRFVKPQSLPFLRVQNPNTPFTLPQSPEFAVSPLNPGTLPGTGAGSTGINQITGLPCSGAGAISVSGAGGLPGSSVVPPGATESPGNIPVGSPPVSSVYGPGSTLGAC